ncbi:MAG: LytTR family DNA-binding domain-containing protein [Chitinophagaceae bacterium]
MQKFFFIRTNGRYVKINFNDIIFVEGCKNYIKIITDSKSYLVLITMKRMEQLLPLQLFARIHKSYIVSLDKVLEFDAEKVCLKDKQLPIGTQYRGALEKAVIIANDAMSESIIANSYYTLPTIINGIHKRNFFKAE